MIFRELEHNTFPLLWQLLMPGTQFLTTTLSICSHPHMLSLNQWLKLDLQYLHSN